MKKKPKGEINNLVVIQQEKTNQYMKYNSLLSLLLSSFFDCSSKKNAK